MSLLDHQISGVASRFRRLDWWRRISIVCMLLAVSGGILLALQTARIWMYPHSGWVLLGAALVCIVLVTIVSGRRFRNDWWVARQVEDHFPELEQRLLTTLDECDRNQGRPLGYLQNTVFQETITHAYHNPWTRIIPTEMLRRFRRRGLVACCLVMAVAVALMRWQPEPRFFAASSEDVADMSQPLANFDIQVEPGNTEIEKGTNLIVIARFGKQVPKQAELVATSGSEELRIPMSRSLDDPLFGGTVSEVLDELEYYVAYDGRKSETYRVTVFMYPELVRADALLEFPSYTEMADKRVEDTRRVSAVEGTRLTWEIHLNKPGIAVELVPDGGGDAIPLQLDATDPLNHLVSLELKQTVSWKLVLKDAEGRENRRPPTLTAKVTPNRPPNLKLELARDARVSPLEEFLVKATVSDDYGLRRFGLNYTLASASPQDVVLGKETPRREKQPAEHLLDFEALEASPDELLSYYFWAEDQDGEGNTRRTLSDMYFAEVRHFEEIFRQGQQPPGGQQQQQQQQQQGEQSQSAQDAEQLAELQKQIINATWKLIRRETASAVTAAFEEDVSIIVESQQAASEQAGQLGQNIQDSESQQHLLEVRTQMHESLKQLTSAYSDKTVQPLTPAMQAQRAAYQALLRLRAREHEVTQGQQQSGQSSRSSSNSRMQQQLQQLQLQNDQNRYETQRQAQEQQDQEQTEMRQALSRLRELAQRQEDLNEQLKELQTALERAETEEEREEIERQLKRLREQQEEMLRDTDELMDRLDEAQTQETLQETREQLEQTREQLRDSAESLERGEVTPALASGTRAQRELEEMKEELRRESANQFSEQMQEMRERARELESRQQEIGERLEQQNESPESGTGLRSETDQKDDDLADALREQNQKLNQLLQEIEETVREAEDSEPLLAENLYDAFRETEDDFVERNLELAAQATDRGLTEQAHRLEEEAREGISNLRGNIEQAAESVLGDETDALRTAVRMLEDLERQLDSEINQFDDSRSREGQPQEGQRQDGRSPESSDSSEQPNEQQGGERQSDREARERQNEGRPSERSESQPSQQPGQDQQEQSQEPSQGESQEPSQNQQGQPNESESQESQNQSGTPSESQSDSESQQPGGGQPSDRNQDGQRGDQRQQPRQPRSLRPDGNQQQRQDGGGSSGNEQLYVAPITGDDFLQWSDQLRDVEEIVDDPEIRAEAARIRERARSFRREFKRHSEEPKWDLVRELVSRPLRELRQNVSEALLLRSAAKNQLVPIDRDPVPEEFAEPVRRYWENLGRGK